jgi:hypothetical protein
MPFQLKLSGRLKARGWKVKIRENERLEPPHITIFCGSREWRVGLRDAEFLIPPGGRWDDIDFAVRQAIQESWDELKQAWDAKYPSNPISSLEEGDEEVG